MAAEPSAVDILSGALSQTTYTCLRPDICFSGVKTRIGVYSGTYRETCRREWLMENPRALPDIVDPFCRSPYRPVRRFLLIKSEFLWTINEMRLSPGHCKATFQA